MGNFTSNSEFCHFLGIWNIRPHNLDIHGRCKFFPLIKLIFQVEERTIEKAPLQSKGTALKRLMYTMSKITSSLVDQITCFSLEKLRWRGKKKLKKKIETNVIRINIMGLLQLALYCFCENRVNNSLVLIWKYFSNILLLFLVI